MKEQYIRQVEKELNLSRKAKTEVVRDLNEIFNSAVEHGETEQQLTAQQNSLELIIPSQRNGNGSFQVSFPLW